MTIKQFLGVVEMRTKLVSLSTLAAATLYARLETGRTALGILVLTLPAVLLVDMGTTAFNSFFDYWRGEDTRSRISEEDKVIVTEGVPALAAFLVAAACYALAAALGLALAIASGFWVPLAGWLCLAIGFLYSGGPLPISRTPLGELFSGLFLGSGLFLIAFRLQAGYWGARPLLASLPLALFISSILAVNNACDLVGDRAAGRRTLAILLGKAGGTALALVLGASAFAAEGALAAFRVLPPACAPAAALSGAAALPIYLGMLARGFSRETKSASMRSVLGAFSLLVLGLVAGLFLGIIAA
jgi:1,4-dihydroxy-2-naphthoate polyprenyltransferase